MLNDIIPAPYRKLVYSVLGAIGLILAALNAAYLSQGHSPTWLVMVTSGYGFVAAGSHTLATGNTPPKKPEKLSAK